MRRNTVVVGDPPSTGGYVLPNGCKSTINKVSKALVGGKVWCEACKTIGVIAKAGGPYRPTAYGVEEVLDGDLVICKCAVLPTLNAFAVTSRPPLVYVDDRVESLGVLPPPFRRFIDLTPWRKERPREAHSIQFLVTNRKSGEALRATSYRIILDNNTEYIGITDSNGLTEIIGNNVPFKAIIEAPYYDGKREIEQFDADKSHHIGDACSC